MPKDSALEARGTIRDIYYGAAVRGREGEMYVCFFGEIFGTKIKMLVINKLILVPKNEKIEIAGLDDRMRAGG
jgi:hypothetical protein